MESGIGKKDIVIFRINLSRNSIERCIGGNKLVHVFRELSDYDGLFGFVCQSAVYEEDVLLLRRMATREKLLFAFSKSQRDIQFSIYMKIENEQCWYSFDFRTLENECNQELRVELYVRNIHEEKMFASLAHRVMASDYDFLAYIDLPSERYKISSETDSRRVPYQRCGLYDRDYCKVRDRFVLPEERLEVSRLTELPYVVEQLQEKDAFNVFLNRMGPNGKVLRKHLTYRYMDETHLTLVLTQKDITLVYEREDYYKNTLERALDSLEKNLRGEENYFSKMSHTIRTSMNSILGMTSLAKDVDGNPVTTTECLKNIANSSENLLKVIDNALSHRKLNDGKLVITRRPFAISELNLQVMECVESKLKEKEISYDNSCQSGIPQYLVGDFQKARDVFVSLILHAISRTPQGGSLHFCCEKKAFKDNRYQLLFSIEDYGVQFPDHVLANSLQEFCWKDEEALKEGEDIGMGLTMSRKVINLLGGTLQLMNIKDGVRCEVIIPFLPCEGLDNEEDWDRLCRIRRSNMAKYGDNDAIDFSGRRVMIVEDHPLSSIISTKLMQKKNCQVDCVPNGAEAIRMFGQSSQWYYDAILMDIRMPEMDGLTAAGEIRQLNREDASHIPILAISANNFADDLQRALRVGITSYLVKPLDPELLYETLNEIWSTSG